MENGVAVLVSQMGLKGFEELSSKMTTTEVSAEDFKEIGLSNALIQVVQEKELHSEMRTKAVACLGDCVWMFVELSSDLLDMVAILVDLVDESNLREEMCRFVGDCMPKPRFHPIQG